MGLMSFLDPGGIGRSVLNWNPMTEALSPYLSSIGGGVGGLIGMSYGGPGGAALGAGVGAKGGADLSTYLRGDDPWSGENILQSSKKGAVSAGTAYLAGSALQGAGVGGGSNLGYTGVGAYEAGGGGLTAGAPGIGPIGTGGAGAYDWTAPSGEGELGYTSMGYNPSLISGEESLGLMGATPTTGYSPFLDYGGGGLSTTPAPTAMDAAPSAWAGGGNLSGAATPSSSNALSGPASGSTLDTLAGYYKKYWPYVMGMGLVSNVAGNYMNAQQQKENLGQYIGATTWTPEKAGTYLTASNQATTGALSGTAARSRGTLAERMAAAGRGGGGYAQQSAAIDARMLEEMARARNEALALVSTPPNLSPAPFMSQGSPAGASLTGISGIAGNVMTTGTNAALLSELLRRRQSGMA